MVNTRVKTSLIVQNQLPAFVRDEFPLVSEFLKQYYISLDSQSGPSDILQNIDQYLKVDNLTNITDNTTLSSDVSFFDKTINVQSTYGFPDHYGLILIDGEIITYKTKTAKTFEECVRGFSGITSLKKPNEDSELVFTGTNVEQHVAGSTVTNLSVLFLKEFFKKTKKLFTPGFEDIEFDNDLNEKVFIKQSRDFYSSKGTDESFKILFGALFGEPVKVIKPRDYLIRPSDSQYRVVRDLIVEPINNSNIFKLLNRTIFQSRQQNIDSAYGTVTNVQTFSDNGKTYYVLSLDYDYDKDIILSGSIYGNFSIHPKTKAVSQVSIGQDFIDVDSTVGFPESGTLKLDLPNNTTIKVTYTSKSYNQFFGCSGVTQIIPEENEIKLDVFASNYEDVDNAPLDDLVTFNITGVISNFNFDSDTRYFSSGDEIYIKALGEELSDPKYKTFLYNLSVGYDIETFRVEGDNNTLKYSFKTFDENIINIGDKVLLRYVASFPSGVNQRINRQLDEIVTVRGINIPKKEFSTITNYPVIDAISAKRLISKTDFLNYPQINGKYNTNVSNVYIDNDDNFYVTSSSLASYERSIETKERFIEFGGVFQETNVLTVKDHGFYTGEAVRYTYTDVSNKIINLIDKKYYVERIDADRLKLYNSQIDIYTTKYSGSGRDLSISLLSSLPSNNKTNRITLDNLTGKDLNTSKIIRKFSTPRESLKIEETKPGFVGLLANGVEILNYKSKDSIYYGPIEKVEVTDSGDNYDVINPPLLRITDNIGYGATGNVNVTGSLKKIEIIDQGYDYLETPIITITGGNGSGALAEAKMISYDHSVSFNASQFVGAVDLSNETISFSTYHRFRDYEKVIYETSNQAAIAGLTTGSSYYVDIVNPTTVKLHRTFEDAVAGINTIGLSSFGAGIHSLRSTNKKKKVGSIVVTSSGSNYSNKKHIVYSSGIDTSRNVIRIPDHGYQSGEIIEYSYTNSPIIGLSSTNYYVKSVNKDEFHLYSVGIGSTEKDFYYKTNQYVDLLSSPLGEHIFNYPEIQVVISGKTGVSTITPGNQNAVVNPIFRGSITSVSLASTLTNGSNVGGTGYGSRDIINYIQQPQFSLLSGSNAQLTPVILNGSIVEVVVENGGSGYVSTPDIEIIGDGSNAQLTPIILNGSIKEVKIISGGSGYSDTTFINVTTPGSGANLYAKISEWKINLYERENLLDKEGAVIVESLNAQNLQYSHIHLPEYLRKILFSQTFVDGNIVYIADFSNDNIPDLKKNHSPIVGWAYDGNPIYGPYGYSDPFSSTSQVRPLRSGYIRNTNLQGDKNRPPFDVGFFVNDYLYRGIGDLDEHNGRYCVTPEYPNGTYAYFCTIDPDTKAPVFPFIIGNSFRNLPIDFNFQLSSTEDKINLNSTGWRRNTYPYNLNLKNSRYPYIFDSSKIRNQTSNIRNTFSGSIDSVTIKSGGDGYEIGDLLSFDETNSKGFGCIAKVESVKGKEVTSISYTNSNIENIEFFNLPNSNLTVGLCTSPHNLNYGDVVSIGGLSTSTTKLYNSFRVNPLNSSLKLASGIGSTGSTGIVTYFNILGNLDAPYLMENDILRIGNEKIKVLNVERENSRIRALRAQNGTVGVSHSIFQNIFEDYRKFSINGALASNDFIFNREYYFNPSETLGIGTLSGVGIGYTLSFSNPGYGETTKIIPTKSLYFKNHGLKTGDILIYSSNGQTPISVSTNGSSQFQLQDNSIVYVAKLSNDLIGISTFKVGLSTTGSFVGVDSSFKSQGTLFLTSSGSGVYHSFKTNYNNILKGSASKITATLSTIDEHELKISNSIEVNVTVGVSTTIKIAYSDSNRRLLLNPRPFTSSNVDFAKNEITIPNHGYVNGQKVIHLSSSPFTGLLNDKIYYVSVVSRNIIKLSETYYNSTKKIPEVVDISNTSGTNGTLYAVNPSINAYKNQDLIFDISDSSLAFVQNSQVYSAFKLEFFTDSNFINKLNTKNITQNLTAGTAGATLTLKLDDSIPDKIYYNLIPLNSNRSVEVPAVKKLIITDSENITNNNQIAIINSKYSGRHIISGVTTNTISYVLDDLPERGSYISSTSSLSYNVYEGISRGPINSIIVTSGGKNYTTLPGITSVITKTGTDAILIPESSNIGRINSVDIISYGFDYSVDKTINPLPNLPVTLKIEPLNSIDRIDVIAPGKNYTIAPNLVLIDGFTEEVVQDLELSYNLKNNTISVVKNTSGIYSAEPRVVPVNNSNGSKIKNIGFTTATKDVTIILDVGFLSGFSTATDFPFAVGDKILIENTSVLSTHPSYPTGFVPRGYNTKDYDYNLFTITSIDPNIGGVNPSIVFNVSDYFTGTDTPGIFDSLKSSGRVVAEKDFPTFKTILKKNIFFKGERVINGNSTGVVQNYDADNEYLRVSTRNNFTNDTFVTGRTSGSQGIIKNIITYNSRYDIGSSSVIRSGSNKETGFLNNTNQRIHDNDYYQYFAYSLNSKISYDNWSSKVDSLNHTAGFKKFSDLVIESEPTYPSSFCNTVSGICTNQNFGIIISTADILSESNLNCVYDFDYVTENSININGILSSDEIRFESRIIQDHIEASGNVVLSIDDFSNEFDNTPREDVFSVVNEFDLLQPGYKKYFVLIEDEFFTEIKQYGIVSLLHDESNSFTNQYAALSSVEDLGSFDFRVFGSRGQLLFYPTNNRINNYNLFFARYDLDSVTGIGTTNLGNVVSIQTQQTDLSVGSSSTSIVSLGTTYRSAKLLVYISSDDFTYNEVDELTIIHDNTDVYLLEYGQLDSDLLNPLSITGIGTYNAYISGGNVNVDLIAYNSATKDYNINTAIVAIGDTTSSGIGTYVLSTAQLKSSNVSIASSTNPVANIIATVKNPSKGAYCIISVEDTTNNNYQVSEFVVLNNGFDSFITDFGNIETGVGIGTFSTSLSGSDLNILFTPNANIDVQVRTFANEIKPTDTFSSFGNIDLGNLTINEAFGFYIGAENDVRRSFYITHNNLPIFHRYFEGNNSAIVDVTNNLIRLPDHFFRTGERVTYFYDNYQNTTENAIGIGTTFISVGVGTTSKLPRDLYVVKVDNYSIRLSSTAENALKLVPDVLDLTSVGIGTNHRFTAYNENNRVLISIDNIIQSPLVSTATTTSLLENINFSDTLVKISSVNNIFPENLLNINDEIVKVSAVGVGSTNIIRVERRSLGSELKTHASGSLVSKVEGGYNIVDNVINFVEAPYGPSPIGTITNPPDERDYTGLTTTSRFNGRVFMRSSAVNSTADPYDKNYIFDDISHNFSGIRSDFSLTVRGSNVSGISSSNGIILLNDIFQGPENSDLSSVVGNYYFEENAGITSIFFKGSGIATAYDINTSGLPIGGIIVSVGSSAGLGYQPLVAAGGTAIVSAAGTIQSISIGNSGSGYRSGVQVVNVSVATSSLTTRSVEVVGIASISNGHIVSIAITNPGTGYTFTNPPEVIFDLPLSYTNIPLRYTSSSSGIGTEAKVDIVVGQGSSVINFELISDGYNYKIGDRLTIPVGGPTGIPTDPSVPFNEFTITVDQVYNNKFAGWTVGDIQILDDFSNEFDGNRKIFQLKLNNRPISILRAKNSSIDLSSTLLVFINDILQVPNEAYTFDGGSLITFKEAPKGSDEYWGGDTLKMYFYRGTSSVDTRDIDILETVKPGDELQIYGNTPELTQTDRNIDLINSANSVITNTYTGPGISTDETLRRPVVWCRQTVDKVINGKVVGKDRELYEPNIEPYTNIIQNVGFTTNIIFVENLRTFFDNEKENASNVYVSKIKIISQDAKVGAYATAVVSNTGSISYIDLINPGVGYTYSPTITISSPVGLGSTALVTSTVSGGSITGLTTIGFGSNYSQSNPPQVLIEPPITDVEIIEGVTYQGDFGIVSGISTGSVIGIASTALTFDLVIENDSFLRDFNIVGTSVTVSGIQTGYYFVIKNSNVGNGVTSLDENGNVVSIGTSYLDNIYKVVSVSIGNTNAFGIGSTYVAKVSVSLSSYNGLSGIGYSNFYGEYSWGRIVIPNGARRTPKSFAIDTTNGIIGIDSSAVVKRLNPLKYTGYAT